MDIFTDLITAFNFKAVVLKLDIDFEQTSQTESVDVHRDYTH